MQMDCCGRVYCKHCLTENRKRSKRCPHCRKLGKHFTDRRSQTFRLLPSLKGDVPTRKRRRQPAQSHSTEPLAQFILNAFYSCSELFPKSRLKAPLSSEFEALFWAELKARNVRKRKENHSLSRLKKQSVLQLEQDVLTEAGDYGLDDYQPLGAQGADGDSDDDGRADQSSFTLPGLEAGFEGAFHGFTEGHPPPPSSSTAHPLHTSFQGVGPMALDDSWSQRGGRQTGGAVVQSYEELVRNYVESTMAAVLMYVQETELSKRVANWEDRIKPRLLAEERHTAFDIHQYGASVLSEFASRRCQLRTDKLLFREIALNKEQFEVCRLFAATLQLANDCNVEISSVASEERGAGAMDIMQLVLLSTRMAHETVSNYQVPSHAQQK